jgi:hypothetical protein
MFSPYTVQKGTLMAAPQPARVGDVFTRRLIDNGLQIESRCNFCGVAIVGTARDNDIKSKEQQHVLNCPKMFR